MIKITSTIKTLILEFIAGNGSGHIKEIHLKVTEFRPNVPEHTVRARLSEMSRSDNLEEKLSAFGSGFYGKSCNRNEGRANPYANLQTRI